MHEASNPIAIAELAVESLGWRQESSEDALFQNSLLFVAQTRWLQYHAQLMNRTEGVLHLELAIEFENIPILKQVEYLRLLNLINQDISYGSLCHISDEEMGAEYLVHRAQLLYPAEQELSEKEVTRFIQTSVEMFDLCVPHIAVFLGKKAKGFLDKDGVIESVQLQITPEDAVAFILAGDTMGYT